MFTSFLYKASGIVFRKMKARYVNAFVALALLSTSITGGVTRASAGQARDDDSAGT